MISVCMATFNGQLYIKEQLESILKQISPEDEIIISDDGSTDDTIGVIRSFQSPIIHIYTNEGEHGYTPNFENALRHAKGDYIFICDQDDIWREDKVKKMVGCLQKYDLVISDAKVVDHTGKNVIKDSFFSLRKSRQGLINNLIRYSYLGCCTAFNKKILDKALPFPKNHSYCTHDNWLCIVGMSFFKAKVIDDKLISYRRHKGNTSSGGVEDRTTFFFKINYRIYLIWWLLKRGLLKSLVQKS